MTVPRSSPKPPARRAFRPSATGLTQLSIVEHALCPLDARVSLVPNFVHQAQYYFTTPQRHRQRASVRVSCPDGLSASDEFYLWGMLALTFAQSQSAADFFATPHYCLRHMGCLTSDADRGGRNYDLFRHAISRLASVTYHNDRFYDPVRGEHRQVAFGFFSYSLPIDPHSSRAWRFAWDPIFFEFCQATGSALAFDLATYRSLDGATRRLYLLLKKIFWRNDTSPDFELRHLAVDVLGFADTHEPWKLKQKLTRCIEALLTRQIVQLPLGATTVASLFTTRSRGSHTIRFHRGPHFDSTTRPATNKAITDSPFYDQLEAIGFDQAGIQRILTTFKPPLIAAWADITLAAKERNGDAFFKKNPAAYFLDNIRHAAEGTRTPPDWWHELRKVEERRRHDRASHERHAGAHDPSAADRHFRAYLETEARDAFERTMNHIFEDLRESGVEQTEARAQADHIARMNLRSRFNHEHPEYNDAAPAHAADLFQPPFA